MPLHDATRRRRGEPVVALGALLAAWVGLRAVYWETPFDGPLQPTLARRGAADRFTVQSADVLGATPPVTAPQWRRPGTIAPRAVWSVGQAHPLPPLSVSPTQAAMVGRLEDARVPAQTRDAVADSPGGPATPYVAAPSSMNAAASRNKSWRIDAWALWRPGSGLQRIAAGGPMAPAYGGTQGGVVARYRLTDAGMQPDVYIRLTHAPSRPSQTDAAVGFSMRPLREIPVRLHAETRVTRDASELAIRPAMFAVSEWVPVALPLGLTAEAYAQAGWVGGRYATPFVDGQLRVDRPITRLGPATLRAGAGAWGGAQRFAERLDAGPSLTIDMRDGPVPLRASLDYRFRLAGDARPGNGIAVTLSTGF